MSGLNFVVESFCDGENLKLWSDVSKDKLRHVEKILGTDFVDDITQDNPVKIRLITDKQLRESHISGLMYDGNMTRDEAIAELDTRN